MVFVAYWSFATRGFRMKRISEMAYPLDVWIWEQYAFSKGHHDPALFVVHLEVDHGMGLVDPKGVRHVWYRRCPPGSEFHPCMLEATAYTRGAFPVTEIDTDRWQLNAQRADTPGQGETNETPIL